MNTVVRNLDLRPDTPVTFNDGKGNQLTGRIVRVWGRRAINITIKAGDGRTFVRDLSRVTAASEPTAADLMHIIIQIRVSLARISGQLARPAGAR